MRHLIVCTVLTLIVLGFQTNAFSAQVSVEPSKKSTAGVKQQTKASKSMELPTAEVRNNKLACQEYCRKTENCKCEKRVCSTGWKKTRRWSGIDEACVACE